MNRPLVIGDVCIPGRVLLAPMTGVSDLPFRLAASRLGAPYVATEMVASELLAAGRPDVVRRAAVGAGLPLTVIQLVGRNTIGMAKGAAMAEAAGADIIDINMGCPAKDVTGGFAGSALMRDLDLAKRLIDATIGATTRPVTLKMRLGWDEMSKNGPELAALAEAAGVQAITVHGRTRQQFYTGSADWGAVALVKAAVSIPVIVNGDIVNGLTARQALEQSGADAIMIGRGAYGRPWIARSLIDAGAEPDLEQRLCIALEHFQGCLSFYGDSLGVRIFRKHLGWYVEQASFPRASSARRSAKSKLCQMTQPRQIEMALTNLWRGAIGIAA